MITHPTHDTLSENVSTQVVECRCRRRSFLDKVAITALDYAELIAKRAAALAGSDGAIQFATERCLLIPYTLQIAGEKRARVPACTEVSHGADHQLWFDESQARLA